ncbi:MAG TPA: hypothetical protein VH054_06050 [Polyangiaceae bacterium]|nr:hypothetical protein [Polyangiaceae bacterium]
MQRRTLGLAFAMLGMGACGLDESGESGDDASSDVTTTDGNGNDAAIIDGGAPDVSNDVSLPPTCASLDVSCLGFDAGAPDGWVPFVVSTSACPSGDYTGTAWQANARLAPNACTCTCTSSGVYACPSQITVTTGGACTTSITVDAGACTVENPASQHMELPNAQVASSNGAACASDASAAATATDAVTLCSIGCDAGVQGLCSQATGTRCIATDGVVPCPSGLTQRVVGSGAIGMCNACGCKIGAPPACTASAQVYFGYLQNGYQANTNCSTQGQFNSQMLTLNQTCQLATFNYDSFSVAWGPLAAPTCDPGGGGGDAGLASPKTLCCN